MIQQLQDARTASQVLSPSAPPIRHWLTEEEHQLLSALASLIVPSDERGPGAREADVAARLDHSFLSSHERQCLYRAGLPAFQVLARRLYGQALADLPRHEQLVVLNTVERAHRQRNAGGAQWHHRIRRRLVGLLHAWRGWTDAVALFPILVTDVIETFYCSPTAWKWLGYPGPPFPRGWYPTLNGEASHD
jgi:hypothetical protein